MTYLKAILNRVSPEEYTYLFALYPHKTKTVVILVALGITWRVLS